MFYEHFADCLTMDSTDAIQLVFDINKLNAVKHKYDLIFLNIAKHDYTMKGHNL